MSTLTDPTSTTPPGDWIDTDPIIKRLEFARLEATLAARTYFESKDRNSVLLDDDEQQARQKLAAERDVWAEFLAAMKHNEARRLTAREGIAEARLELTAAQARANGYPTADAEAEAAGRDQQHREQDGLR